MVAVEELFREVVAEIAHKPVVFAVEVVQFAILVVGIWLLATKILGPMLDRRRADIGGQLEEAAGADKRLAEAKQQAKRIIAEAKQQAQERLREAKENSAAAHDEAMAAASEEAAQIVERARQTLRQEQEDAVNTVHAQLVDLVAVATRGVLEEALSEDERRDLVEKSVLSSLEELEDVALAE